MVKLEWKPEDGYGCSKASCLSHGNVEREWIPFKSIYLGQTSMEREFVSRWCFTQASALKSIQSDINVDIYHIELGIDLNRSAQVDLMHL